MRKTPQPVIDVQLVMPDGEELSVGTLKPTNVRATQSATFQYTITYLSDPRAYPLEPELPLVDWPLRTTGRALFRCMDDSTPDRWGRALIDREANHLEHALANKPRSTLEIDYLVGVRDDTRQGALRYFSNGFPLAGAEQGVTKLVDLGELLELTDEMLLDPQLDIDLKDLVAAGSSLGGARPKASVLDDDGRLMIAKFPNVNSDNWDVSAWEKLALDLATASGITVPGNHLVEVLGRRVLMLERFDRHADRRVGYLSALTLASADDGDHSVSFADLAEFLEPQAGNAERDLPQLFRRALFWDGDQQYRQSLTQSRIFTYRQGLGAFPAFDLNPNPQGGSFAVPFAPGLNGRGMHDVAKSAREWSEFFRVTPAQSKDIIAEINEAVSGWKAQARQLGIPNSEIQIMAPAFKILF